MLRLAFSELARTPGSPGQTEPRLPGSPDGGKAGRLLRSGFLPLLALATLWSGGVALAHESEQAAVRPPTLVARLDAALAGRGPDYRPNTHLLNSQGSPRYTNRLILEASPYLLQHAHNPVDWHGWGDEALEMARRLDRPVFLSVGYATCHWCHVMEEESFDNEQVAALLNASFVPIKLDREARPDLDHVYMLATQMLTGHGGWPNSVFLLPDGRPFYAGSYFPRQNFVHLLASIVEAWQDSGRRSALEQQAARLTEAIASLGARRADAARLGEAAFRDAAAAIGRAHNVVDGGFSRSMQFPQEVWLLFLLDHWRRHGDATALGISIRSLRAIAVGGIHDHVGGGFHRYTVDANWRTPHFEKMLYNQALLARSLVDAHAATGEPAFRRAAGRVFDYVARDMTVGGGDAAGAFFAAEDADSLAPSGRREEGYFYAWTPDSVREALGEADGAEAVRRLGLGEPPTLECGAVAHLPRGGDDSSGFDSLDPLLERMRFVRDARPRPRRDDKVITEWNGMMIRALAEGSMRLPDPDRIRMAESAAEGVRRALWTPGHGFCRFHAEGRSVGSGQLPDYACMGLASLALHDATTDFRWRDWAVEIAEAMEARFDDGAGRYRFADADSPLGPVYDADDAATPSGESAALEFLARLSVRTGDPVFSARAEALRDQVSGAARSQPQARTGTILAAGILEGGETETSRSVARGNGRATAFLEDQVVRVEVLLAQGWHVNSDQPSHPDLIPTELEIASGMPGAEIVYPPPVERDLGFMDEPLALFESEFTIRAVWPAPPVGPLQVSLTIQPCSDRICLPPETHLFRLR